MAKERKLKLVSGRPSRMRPLYTPSRTTVVAAMVVAATIALLTLEPAAMSSPVQATGAQPERLTGRATVVDGDTIEIKGERIRFNGIDAPESRQSCKDGDGRTYRCGAMAAKALDGHLAASRPTRCDYVERDRYGRFVGDCFRADGKSVAAWLVRQGHALDWPRYSNGDYADEQASAKAGRKGIWQGTFEAPWDWRAMNRSEQAPKEKHSTAQPLGLLASAGCKIKGNINGEGERIYHVPGQKFYANTRVATDRGERWFCSEAEARAAGWRRARS